MSEWKARPPLNGSPGNPWWIEDANGETVAIIARDGSKPGRAEALARRIVADHNRAAQPDDDVRAALAEIAEKDPVHHDDGQPCAGCEDVIWCAREALGIDGAGQGDTGEIARLKAALEAADSILWMASAYAEGGGRNGPEMADYEAAEELIRAALRPQEQQP